jgi:predicted RNA binding protein YcfA (HicA-like mRNA interferase family)
MRGEGMSQWKKLIAEILKLNNNLRFDDLANALIKMGYSYHQPRSGGSHYTFRKASKTPITLPKATPMNKAYIALVRDAVIDFESEGE